MAENVIMLRGLKSSYSAAIHDSNTLYFCIDTYQLYLGDIEYTSNLTILSQAPTSTTEGVNGRLYYYSGNVYICIVSGSGTTISYNYIKLNFEYNLLPISQTEYNNLDTKLVSALHRTPGEMA